MKWIAIALGFCLPLSLTAKPPSIYCSLAAERPVGFRYSSFVEGVDDYLLTLRLENTPNSVLALVVPVDYGRYTWEIRLPKLIRQPELAPTCFLDVRAPFLFTCDRGAVNALSTLTEERTFTTQEIELTGLWISATSKTTRTLDVEGKQVQTSTYVWSLEIETKGKKQSQSFTSRLADCRTELP